MENFGTKSLREVADDEAALESWRKKIGGALKHAARKTGQAVKFLANHTPESIDESICSIAYCNLSNMINDEALEAAKMLEYDIEDMILISSRANPTKYMIFRKLLMSKQWQLSCCSQICPDVASMGKLSCYKTGDRLDTVAAFYNDGNRTPVVTFIIHKMNYERFVNIIDNTILT